MRKRFLAFILTVCMVTALVPTSGAADSSYYMEFDFKVKSNWDTYVYSENAEYLNSSGKNRTFYYSKNNGTQVYIGYGTDSDEYDEAQIGQWAAFKLQVSGQGAYEATLYNYETIANYFKGFDIYMIPASKTELSDDAAKREYIWNAINSGNYPAVTSLTDNTSPHTFEVTLDGSDEYLFVLCRASKDRNRFGFTKLTLASKGESVILSSALSVKDGYVTLVGELSDGRELSSVVEATYASADESVATIEAKSGKISDVKPGITIISASFTFGGEEYTESVIYEVEHSSEDIDWSGVDVLYDFLNISTSWNAEKVIAAGYPDADTSKQNDIRGVTYEYSGNWEYRGTGSAEGFGVWTPDNNDMTSNFTSPSGASSHMRVNFGADSSGTTNTSYAAFNVKIPKVGRYSAEVEYYAAASQGDADLYLIPIIGGIPADKYNDVIDDLCTEKYYIGRFNSRDDSLKGQTPSYEIRSAKLNKFDVFEAGEYVLVFRRGDRGSQVRLKKLYFNGINDLDYINVNISDSEIRYDKEETITVEVYRLDDTIMENSEYETEYSTIYRDKVSVRDGIVRGIGDGKDTITVRVSDATSTREKMLDIVANDDTGIDREKTKLSFPGVLYVRGAENLSWDICMNSGNVLKFPFDQSVEYTVNPEGVVTIDENGKVFAYGDNVTGKVTITAKAEFKGELIENSVTFEVMADEGKTEPTYYTEKMRANALENVGKYSWAKTMQRDAIAAAEKYVNNLEVYYDNFPEEGIARSRSIGYNYDLFGHCCRWCGVDSALAFGDGDDAEWSINPITRPWKIQCMNCKRVFPSNDFALFYNRCVDKYGYFDTDLARELNTYYVEVLGEKDALKNELYPDLTGVCEYGALREGESIEDWGVDDGRGYMPLKGDGAAYCANRFDSTHVCNLENPIDNATTAPDANSCIAENHCYIACYVNSYIEEYRNAITALAEAYLYTGDEKYGVAGAILLDRLSDVYTTFDHSKYQGALYETSSGVTGHGQILGAYADSSAAIRYAKAADAFFPCLENTKIISFLEKKSEEKWLGRFSDKSSARSIWKGWEKNLLEPMWDYVKNGRFDGNYGYDESVVALSALVLDKEPETTERIKWLWQTGTNIDKSKPNSKKLLEKYENGEGDWYNGGGLATTLIDICHREGVGDEVSPAYLVGWINRLAELADALEKMDIPDEYQLYTHPKFIAMYTAFKPILVSNYYTAQIGDTRGTAGDLVHFDVNASVMMFEKIDEMGLPEDVVNSVKESLAQMMYITSGYDVSSINYGIFKENPESIQKEIAELTDEKIPAFDSEMMSGYAFAILRDGARYLTDESDEDSNTQRSIYMTFNSNNGHTHRDVLNIGMDAYGLNIAPDLGYPTDSGYYPERWQWTSQALAHNTVSIDRETQDRPDNIHGYPLHFDDSGEVQLMDVSAPWAYQQAENYRRTVVMVRVDDTISYGVDFFRVTGGDVHTYSFHSQAQNAYAIEGLDSMEKQVDANGNYTGTYAANFGAPMDYPVGKDPNSPNEYTYKTVYPRGYTWLKDVRRDLSPERKIAVEFDVEDWKKVTDGGDDIVLRLTQMSNFTPDEVAIAKGPTPERAENKDVPRWIDNVMIHREAKSGEKLDSLFATVLEPYKEDRRYLSDMNPCDIEAIGGNEADDDVAYAVKVDHKNGRVDYIIYATNNSVVYRVDNLFNFCGFVGVYSINGNGDVIYRYVHDGSIIGDMEGAEESGAFKGKVVDWQSEISTENYIDVDFGELNLSDEEFNLAFANKYVFVENDGARNGVYKIEGARSTDDGKVRLLTGLISPIRMHIDKFDIDGGYVYNIAEGQSATVYTSFIDKNPPEFSHVGENLSTSVGSLIRIDTDARSSIESNPVTYVGTVLPRGATIDAESGIVEWKPSASQVGENHFAITAVDNDGRESTIRFNVSVYGSTTGGTTKPTTPSEPTTPSTPSEPTTPSTPAGGDGGGTSAPTTPTESEKEDVVTPTTPDVEVTTERFIDLGNHAWARDAINALADAGIIKGTSENTFSPANNITRADFTILLVRAFELSSDNAENFADVSDSDYFAKELAIARNTGIVNGIGDNKYAPRNTITRQDMMTIVYRAMQKLDVELETKDVEYADFNDVADYAKEAVSALITAGLVNGKRGKIAPTDYTTRAEVAVLIKRILDYTK